VQVVVFDLGKSSVAQLLVVAEGPSEIIQVGGSKVVVGALAEVLQGALIPADLSDRLQQTARFRNLLVHIYWKIDYGQVYEILQRNPGDLRQFASIVAALT
jgi:hypothetical protein